MDYPKGLSDEERYQANLQREKERVESATQALSVELTKAHRDLLNFVEQYWYTNQAYPSIAAFARYADSVDLPVAEVRVLELDLIGYLKKRGISQKNANSRLSDEQLAAANLILNYMDKRSKQVKLQSLGISTTKWDGWLRDKKFAEYLKHRTNELLDINLHVAHGGLLNAVERGESSALKLYYEMTGIYKSDTPQANINLIIVQLMEVIQRLIPDQNVLRKIHEGFELVMLRNSSALTPELENHRYLDGEVVEARENALDAYQESFATSQAHPEVPPVPSRATAEIQRNSLFEL